MITDIIRKVVWDCFCKSSVLKTCLCSSIIDNEFKAIDGDQRKRYNPTTRSSIPISQLRDIFILTADLLVRRGYPLSKDAVDSYLSTLKLRMIRLP
jgi:hypothetical protein